MIELLNSRSTNEHKLSWKIPYIFDGSGTLSATLMTVQSSSEQGDNDEQQSEKPLSTSSVVHIQFLAENALFSSIDFAFACRGYRVSLMKKKICSGTIVIFFFFTHLVINFLSSGKYQSESDHHGPVQFFKRPSVDQHHLSSISTPLVA